MAGIVIGVFVSVAFVVAVVIVVWYFHRRDDIQPRLSKSQFDYDIRSLDQMSVTSEEQQRYNLQRQDGERQEKEQTPTVSSCNDKQKEKAK